MSSRIYRILTQCSALAFKKCLEQNSYSSNVYRTIYKESRCFSTRTTEDISKLIDCPVESNEFDLEQDSYLNTDFEKVAEGDPEKVKQLKLLQLEIHMLKQQGEKIPSKIVEHQWRQLLALSREKVQKERYLAYLWLNETKMRHKKEKQAEANRLWNEKKLEMKKQGEITFTTSSPMMYGLKYMTLFHRIYDTQINRFYNYKLLQAAWFGPDIVIDCGFEPFMKQQEIANCVKQLLLTWSDNREHFNPYNLIFCNVDPKGTIVEKLRNLFPVLDEPDFPFNVTSEHYLDLYPKQRLVYLTPHSNEVLNEVDPNDIYIIGALVDRSKCEPLTLAKAKKEGIRKAKFPLDTYLHWSTGTKSLTINQSLAIMNDKKDGRSWSEAFRHIPARKVAGPKYSSKFEIEREENHLSAKTIREQYRKNLVYDLLLQSKLQKQEKV